MSKHPKPSGAFDTTKETQLGIHEVITHCYALVGAAERPFAPYAVSESVTPKPTTLGPDVFTVQAVMRDHPVAALLSKAATTKAALVSLAGRGFGGDAFALCRVLLENVFVLEWLLPEDLALRTRRIDEYILHFETFKVRSDEIHAKQSTEGMREPLADARAREIAKEVHGDRWQQFAKRQRPSDGKTINLTVRQLAEEARFVEMYEREYFEMSTFIHSSPASIWWDLPETKQFEIVMARHDDLAHRSIALSNVYMTHMLESVDARFDLKLADWLLALRVLFMEMPAADRALIMSSFEEIPARIAKGGTGNY